MLKLHQLPQGEDILDQQLGGREKKNFKEEKKEKGS